MKIQTFIKKQKNKEVLIKNMLVIKNKNKRGGRVQL
jgi:hypothetical protein